MFSLKNYANGVYFPHAGRSDQTVPEDLKRLGLRDAEVAALEEAIVGSPLSGVVIPGLGGIRKLRFSFGGRGKRGGGWVIYFLVLADDTVFMLFAYAKAQQADLSEDQRRLALAIVKELTGG